MKTSRDWCVSISRVGLALLSVGAATLLVTGRVQAATANANLAVSANVIASCLVTAGTLAFGDYDPTAANPVDQAGTFNVACTKGTAPTIGLNNGQNFSSGSRRMTNGTEFLSYELYKESDRTNVWGNAGGAAVTLPAATSNAVQQQTVYGRVPAAQDIGTGNYVDTVVITVTF